jgi:hypothetical protein
VIAAVEPCAARGPPGAAGPRTASGPPEAALPSRNVDFRSSFVIAIGSVKLLTPFPNLQASFSAKQALFVVEIFGENDYHVSVFRVAGNPVSFSGKMEAHRERTFRNRFQK